MVSFQPDWLWLNPLLPLAAVQSSCTAAALLREDLFCVMVLIIQILSALRLRQVPVFTEGQLDTC